MRVVICLASAVLFAVSLAAQTRPYSEHTGDATPPDCRAAAVGLAWQWRNSLGSSKSPLAGVKAAGDGRADVVSKLREGQSHRDGREVQKAYTACADAHGAAFIAYVAATVHDGPCNEAAVSKTYAQIYRSKPSLIIRVRAGIAGAFQPADPALRDRLILKLFADAIDAYRQMNFIQRNGRLPGHDTIRACFAANPRGFFDIVAATVT